MSDFSKNILERDKTVFYRFCYELYKMDWCKSNITPDIQMDAYKNYMEDMVENPFAENAYSFQDYLDEFGFNGQVYACYDEFMDNEYQDIDYMKALLDNKEFLRIYKTYTA